VSVLKQLELLSSRVAAELKSRREAAGLSMSKAAEKAGLAVSFVSYLESGKRKPTVETLARLAWVYGTTAAKLLESCEKGLDKIHKGPV
jgi:transcriptional regulator with XRE-family HTH domain